IAKDVLEHVQSERAFPGPTLAETVVSFLKYARKGIFVVVPLARPQANVQRRYMIEDYEKDVTHCQRLTLPEWAGMFMQPGWSVMASFRVPGVKDNWYRQGWEYGNGF